MRQSFVIIILIGCFFVIGYASITIVFHAVKVIESKELEERTINDAIIGTDEMINRAISLMFSF